MQWNNLHLRLLLKQSKWLKNPEVVTNFKIIWACCHCDIDTLTNKQTTQGWASFHLLPPRCSMDGRHLSVQKLHRILQICNNIKMIIKHKANKLCAQALLVKQSKYQNLIIRSLLDFRGTLNQWLSSLIEQKCLSITQQG